MKPRSYFSPGVNVELIVDIPGMCKQGLQADIADISYMLARFPFNQQPFGAVLSGIQFCAVVFQIFFDLFEVHVCHFQRYFFFNDPESFDGIKVFFLYCFFRFSLHILKFLLVNVSLMVDSLNEY